MTEDSSVVPPDPNGDDGTDDSADQRGQWQSQRRDVEKRWDDPSTLRRAALYVVGVLGVAAMGVVAFMSTGRDNLVWAVVGPAVLGLGGLAALVIAYRVYRGGGTWPIWHGAAWFLLALMLLALGFPMLAIE
ncbi:hypothetical protein VX037_20775 [Gordonia sp. Z-3]|uniref:hypothetical protein n=1 Tax=Gordonia sp. Z-3 TaxID=3115408 RepID=UPI002E2E2E7C|nr:hypothetical protein [Gordonia sp. Z-3]MED5803463.1 hypothetical protein [Gordonia sp. Z-3]